MNLRNKTLLGWVFPKIGKDSYYSQLEKETQLLSVYPTQAPHWAFIYILPHSISWWPHEVGVILIPFSTLKPETWVMKLPQGRTVRDKTFWALKHYALCRTSQTKIYEHPRQAKNLAYLQNICPMYLKERLSSENSPANPPLGKTKAQMWQTTALEDSLAPAVFTWTCP